MQQYALETLHAINGELCCPIWCVLRGLAGWLAG